MHKFLIIFLAFSVLFSCTHDKGKKGGEIQFPSEVKVFKVTPSVFIPSLPTVLQENSGLITIGQNFWTFNDSGGKNILYCINRKGEILKEVEIEGAVNHDWEDITQDENNVYIGDFGNNFGTRKNLAIYCFEKKDLQDPLSMKVKSRTIHFKFLDQQHFMPKIHKSEYDCEAMTALGDTLYLFTKNWNTLETTVYAIPSSASDYSAFPAGKYNVKGLITGADISPDKNKLALSGYNQNGAFVWIFENISPGHFFSGKKSYYSLKAKRGAQTEGICFEGDNTVFISCERNRSFKSQVFELPL